MFNKLNMGRAIRVFLSLGNRNRRASGLALYDYLVLLVEAEIREMERGRENFMDLDKAEFHVTKFG